MKGVDVKCITNISIQSFKAWKYIRPVTIQYTENSNQKSLGVLTSKDSVAIILYNTTRKVLIMVKQFRPAVYISNIPEKERQMGKEFDMQKYPPEIGITLELCAGTVDKDLSLVEIAQEEILEECGYDVPITNLKQIATCQSGVGSSASTQTTYYCEVTDDMRVSAGGGIDDENIDVVEMTIEDIKKYVSQSRIQSPPGLLFSIYWFLYHKAK